MLACIGKLGFVADLVSRPTMIGYLNGLALTIMVGQLPSSSASQWSRTEREDTN